MQMEERVKSQCLCALKECAELSGSVLQMSAEEDRLILSGSVKSPHQRQKAVEIVSDTAPQCELVDRIVVRSDEWPNDRITERCIQAELEDHPEISLKGLVIRVQNGKAVLRGYVDAEWKRMLVSRIAGRVDAVKDVINLVSVAPHRK